MDKNSRNSFMRVLFILLLLVFSVTCVFSYRLVSADNIFGQSIEYEEHGALAKAKTGYAKVLKLNPRHDGASYRLGIIAQKEGQIPAAARFMKKAIALNESESEYHLGLGFLYYNDIKDVERAEDCFKRAHNLNNGNYYACYMLGKLEENDCNIDEAINYYKKAVMSNAYLTVAYKKIALLYGEKGMDKKAKSYWQSVIKLDPKDKDAADYLKNSH